MSAVLSENRFRGLVSGFFCFGFLSGFFRRFGTSDTMIGPGMSGVGGGVDGFSKRVAVFKKVYPLEKYRKKATIDPNGLSVKIYRKVKRNPSAAGPTSLREMSHIHESHVMTNPDHSLPPEKENPTDKLFSLRPIWRAVFRGLAVLLPPLLTIVIFLWAGGIVKSYLIDPLFETSRYFLIVSTAKIVHEKSLPKADQGKDVIEFKKHSYSRVADGTYVPTMILEDVRDEVSAGTIDTPQTGLEVYQRYVELKYLQPHLFVPIFAILFILVLYFLGKFMAAGIGRFFWTRFEQIVEFVPLVREVYGAVKQVCDFVLSERHVQFSRVVAVEWPRKGVWSLAFVTSEGLSDIEKAAGEPVYAVLVPTSPMPATGFTMHVKRSETVELSISLDQALQIIISCGVAIPMRPNPDHFEAVRAINNAVLGASEPVQPE